MNPNLRTGIVSLAVLWVGGGLVACTTQAVTTGTGGSGGDVSTGTGGSTSSGGTTGTGGGGGAYPVSQGVPCSPPAAGGLITNFTYVPSDAAVPVTDQVSFGDYTNTLSGGEFVYPNTAQTPAPTYPLTSLVTASNWHITGTVGDYSGFGFFFQTSAGACSRIDATGYKGISFTISGTVMGQSVTVEVDTLNDTIKPAWLTAHGGTPMSTDSGACDPGGTAATTQYSQTVCVEPTKVVPVGATPTPVTVLWSDFTTGKPDAAPKPTDIVGIRWVLPTPAGAGTATPTTYSLDITVDNIAFIPQ
jgi:hypothetical protein